jgi:uncharacterized NAD(P)/FAD-binding protein YdhS
VCYGWWGAWIEALFTISSAEQIAKREKTLKMLQDKLQSAEQAESVDQAMLARMRATISDMEKQRQTWQDFLQSSRANIVKVWQIKPTTY